MKPDPTTPDFARLDRLLATAQSLVLPLAMRLGDPPDRRLQGIGKAIYEARELVIRLEGKYALPRTRA